MAQTVREELNEAVAALATSVALLSALGLPTAKREQLWSLIRRLEHDAEPETMTRDTYSLLRERLEEVEQGLSGEGKSD